MRRLFFYGIPTVMLAFLVLIFWHIIMLAIVGLMAWRLVLRVHGKGRRGSSFPAKVQAVAVAYAAWNSRWLKPKKGEPKEQLAVTVPAENLGDVPF